MSGGRLLLPAMLRKGQRGVEMLSMYCINSKVIYNCGEKYREMTDPRFNFIDHRISELLVKQL